MVGACSILEATRVIKQGRTIAWEALKSYEFYLRFKLRVACGGTVSPSDTRILGQSQSV